MSRAVRARLWNPVVHCKVKTQMPPWQVCHQSGAQVLLAEVAYPPTWTEREVANLLHRKRTGAEARRHGTTMARGLAAARAHRLRVVKGADTDDRGGVARAGFPLRKPGKKMNMARVQASPRGVGSEPFRDHFERLGARAFWCCSGMGGLHVVVAGA
jgi:hypothetical protein